MVNEFRVTQSDFKKYFIDLLSQNILLKIFIIPPISFFIAIQFFNIRYEFSKIVISWILLMGFLMFFFHVIPAFVIIKRIKRNYKTSKYNVENTSFSLIENGILLECEDYKEAFYKNTLSFVDNSKRFILALNENKNLIVLPKRYLDNDIIYRFLHLLNQKKITNPFRKNIPPYFLAIFCIIPILGGLVGLVTLLFGLFQYKDKFLSIIGAIGIIITLIFSAKMHFESDKFLNTPEMKKSIAQTRLEYIVKDIEDYKKLRGSFPANLKMLSKEEFYLTDPFMEDNENTDNKEFVYEISDSSFIIFSVGIDGKKGTADDIYPSTKIELLHEKK